MKILQIVPEMKGGGGEWLAVSLHRWMAARGIDCRIISLLGETHGHCPVQNSKSTRSVIYRNGPQTFYRGCQRLHREQWTPDVVHAHMYPCQVLTATMVRRFWPKAALSTTEHSTWNRRRRLPFGRHLDTALFG